MPETLSYQINLNRPIGADVGHEAGHMDPVSQARALADSDGDEAKVKSAYISHRVRRLRDQLAMMQQEVDRQASRSKPSKKQRGFTEAEMEQARRKQFTYPYSASGGGAAEVPLPRKRPYRLEDSPKGFELADKGVNARIIQALARHKHLNTTMRYIDLNENKLRNALEIL